MNSASVKPSDTNDSIREEEISSQNTSQNANAAANVDANDDDDEYEKIKRPMSFHIRRIFGFINYCILYALVFFQRTCPSIVSADMAADYKVAIKDLGVFSSIYFYPYAIVQPFAGLLADVVDPALVIGICQLVAGLGAIICGFSKSLSVGCVGRFLVGLGCGPTYVPLIRTIANWFPLRLYAQMCGLALAIGGVGGIIAQGPLSSFAQAVGWRWSFYGIGALGIFFSLLQLIFVRGDPTTHGYEPVNKDLKKKAEDVDSSLKDKFKQLWSHFKQVVSYPWIWIVVVYSVFCSGPFFDISGMWAGPFLTDCYGYSKTKVGNTLIALSVGLIVGSLGVPPLSSLFKTRKWVLCATAGIATVAIVIFAVLGSKVKYVGVIILFLLIGMFTNAQTSVCYPLIREYFHPSMAGTAVGCANIFTFLSSAVFQNISGEVMAKFPFPDGVTPPSDSANSEKGYQIGLWTICAIAMGISTISIAFAKESPLMIQQRRDKRKAKDEKEEENEDVGEDLGEL